MSFWKQNPCVPGWLASAQGWWSGTPLKILEANGPPRSITAIPGITVRRCTSLQEIHDIPRFWWRFYAASSRIRCEMPMSVLEERWRSGSWEIWTARSTGSELVGTVIRRSYRNVRGPGGQARFPAASGVDYFCIHPAWRTKGVGRLLLTMLHNAQRPLQIHFIFWEQFQISIPPLTTGWLWSRRCGGGGAGPAWREISDPDARASFWRSPTIPKVGWWSETPDWKETSLWVTGNDWILLWNQYHRSIPEGHTICLILACSRAEAANAFADLPNGPFGVYCIASSNPITNRVCELDSRWSLDAPYTWIAYNLQGGQSPLGSHPLLCS